MRRFVALALSLVLLAGAFEPAAADVNVERHGEENPVAEVAKSVMWGALAGAVVGGAIALADSGPDNGTPIRWGIVGGTFGGLGLGLWWTLHRPSSEAMLEFRDGTVHAQAMPAVDVAVTPAGAAEARLKLVGVRF